MIHVIASEGGSWVSEYTSLLQDPAHWLFEITTDIVIGLALAKPVGYLWNRWHDEHDKKHHRDNFFGR
jgi:hypothetical protein